MKQQRESYEQMVNVLKDFLNACQKTAPWVSDINTLYGAAVVMAGSAEGSVESAALVEIAARLESIAALQNRVQTILSNLPEHPHWPCEGCERWSALGCNRHTMGGFWE